MDVLLLGAGFSKAIDDRMPLTTELAHRVRMTAAKQDPVLHAAIERLWHQLGDDVEQWASLLGGDAPWLEPSESLQNESLYHRLREMIRDEIDSSEDRSTGGWLSQGAPADIAELAECLHADESVVISLNYDTILERAARSTIEVQARSGADRQYPLSEQMLYPLPMPPTSARLAGTWGAEAADSFQVIKPHGSINWLRDPYDQEGRGSAYYVGFGRRDAWRTDAGPSHEAGLAPIIVPPTIVKVFADPVLRWQWRFAANALRSATRLIVAGCSLRQGDWSLRQLLQTELRDDARVTTVDKFPGLGERAGRLLGRPACEVVTDTLVSDLTAVLDTVDGVDIRPVN